jgi:hypothetical protein
MVTSQEWGPPGCLRSSKPAQVKREKKLQKVSSKEKYGTLPTIYQNPFLASN